MKKLLVILMVVAMASFLFVGCLPSVTPEEEEVVEEEEEEEVVVTGTVVSIPGITGVAVPIYGAAPDLTVTASTQYTGVTTWATAAGVAAGATFLPATVYVATTTLTAKTGFTLTGVLANFFTVAGAAGVSNPADSGVVTSTFAITAAGGAVISIPALAGLVTVPVYGVAPDLTVTATTQYTGTVAWKTAAGVAAGTTFAAGTVYVATITLIPVTGFTFVGVTANFFTVTNADGASNPANSGTVTATYAKTTTVPTVVSAVFSDSDTILITFSEKVDSPTLAQWNAGDIEMVAPIAGVLTATIIYGDGTKYISIDFTSTVAWATSTTTGTIDIPITVVANATPNTPLVALTDYVIAAGGF